MDIVYADTTEQEDKAIQRLGQDIFNIIMAEIFGILGGSSAYNTKLEEISETVMSTVMEIISYIYTAISSKF